MLLLVNVSLMQIIYVSRDPRDSLASAYSFLLSDPQPLSFSEVFNMFISEQGTCIIHLFRTYNRENDYDKGVFSSAAISKYSIIYLRYTLKTKHCLK